MTQLQALELYRTGRYAEMEAAIGDPGYNRTLNRLIGCAKLARGEDGWNNLAMSRYVLDNEWAGEDLDGKVILIQQQEGIGDQIMYARFIPDLIARAREVWMAPVTGLETLFRESFPKLHWGMPDPKTIDYRIGSGIGQWAKASAVPYLWTPANPITDFRITYGRRLRVGLTWKGNPDHPFDLQRSFSWYEFHKLANCDAKFLAFQFDHMPYAGIQDVGIQDAASLCANFIDTAYILKSLDLLISVDTAIVHLAAATQACPVWLILRDPIDFRWGFPHEREDWYPGIRQFRNWSMEGVRNALSQFISEKQDALCTHALP